MKFQKYIREVQRSSITFRHINYKALKTEVKRLRDQVAEGELSKVDAADTFGKQLLVEVGEAGRCWESSLRDLQSLMDELFATADMVLSGDAAHGALCGPLGPMALLEPLRSLLPIAALADALRRHRLLLLTATVKIAKKFVKVVGEPLGAGRTAADLLERSVLSGGLIHVLCRQLEAAGDALLRLGLGVSKPELTDPCPVCFEATLADPARLPCGHRLCVQCALPLFSRVPYNGPDQEEGGLGAALVRCPLCRAAGPEAPQEALCLDSLLARLGRGLAPELGLGAAAGADESQHFTAVVISSLERLASHGTSGDGVDGEQCSDGEPCREPIRRSRSILPFAPPPQQETQGGERFCGNAGLMSGDML